HYGLAGEPRARGRAGHPLRLLGVRPLSASCKLSTLDPGYFVVSVLVHQFQEGVMISIARSATPLLLIGALAAAFLVGCSSQPTPEPAETPPVSGGSSTQDPCIVGVWTLDVEAYRAVSEEYLLGLPLPIEGF